MSRKSTAPAPACSRHITSSVGVSSRWIDTVMSRSPAIAFNGMFVSDLLSQVLKAAILLSVAATLLYSREYLEMRAAGELTPDVIETWVDPVEPYGGRKSLFREQYNALGKRNLAAIERIVSDKYQRGAGFNRQHPFVDVLFSDIAESGEVLDVDELA